MKPKTTKRSARAARSGEVSAAASIPPDEFDDVRLIPSRDFRLMLGGISEMQLWRWIHDPEFIALGFPQPIKLSLPPGKKPRVITTRNFFRFREAKEFIARREAASRRRKSAA